MLLYEISIWIAWYDARIKKKAEAMEEKERLERILNSSPPSTIAAVEMPGRPADEFVEPLMTDTEEGEEPDVGDKPDQPEKSE